MAKEPKKTIMVCNACGKESKLRKINLQEAEIYIGQERYWITYFECPHCHKIYRVSLEDEECKAIKKEIEQVKEKIRKSFGTKELEYVSLLYKLLNLKTVQLRERIEFLFKKYPKTFTYKASENNQKEITYLP